MTQARESILTIKIEKSIVRLDQAVLDKLRESSPGISRNQVKALFEEKKVKLNGVSRPASWSLLPGSYEIEIVGMGAASGAAQAMPSTQGSFLPIAYEDDELLVINKASGVPSVPHSSEET